MIRPIVGVLSALLLTAACTAQPPATQGPPTQAPGTQAPATDAPATQAPGTAQPGATTIRVVQSSTPDFTQIALTKWQQLLEEQGVTVEFVNVEGGDVAFRTMIAGSADFNVGGITHLVNLVQATDEEVKLIAIDAVATDYIIVCQPEITSVDQLVGARLGINRPGDSGDSVMRAALRGVGFDVEQAEFLQIGGTSARVAALLSGQIDCGPAHAAEAFTATDEGLTNLMLAHEGIGPYPQTGLMTTEAYLTDNPELTQRVVDAFVEAQRWAAGSKDEYIELSHEVVEELSDDIRSRAYDVLDEIGLFGVDGGLTPELLESFIEIELQAGTIEGEVPPQDEWVDFSFVDDYLERNGPYEGD